MIGIIENPIIKQLAVVKYTFPILKLTVATKVLMIERREIKIIDNLYFFLISTKAPKQPEPTRPPTMKTAPKIED